LVFLLDIPKQRGKKKNKQQLKLTIMSEELILFVLGYLFARAIYQDWNGKINNN
jgi:hypothetical protein